MTSDVSLRDLRPTSYHEAVLAHLKASEPELWRWASSLDAEREHAQQMRAMLLKECYRLEVDAHAGLLEQARRVAERLGIAAPITLYQASGGTQLNAALYYVPGEAHVVFTGAVLGTLGEAELEAVLAHELAHYVLWEERGREFLVADRLMQAAAGDDRAAASHVHTARRLRLYTEIYADRGAFLGCGRLEPAICALVKMQTGLREVSAASYLRQADELFALGEHGSSAGAHPELFIRARALRLWTERDAGLDPWLASEIERTASLDDLDLPAQQRTVALTKRFLAEILRPEVLRSEALLAHARSFFPHFAPGAAEGEALEARECESDWCREYLSYLLLDFSRLDRDLEDRALVHALACSERLGFRERFEQLAAKELGLGKRQLAKLRRESAALAPEVAAP